MSLLRARFDECQSVVGSGATHNGGLLPNVRACKEARVRRFVRHPQCSLHFHDLSRALATGKSYRSWKSEGNQRRAASRYFTRRAPRSSSTVLHQPGSGMQSSQAAAHAHIALSKQSGATGRAPRSAIKTAAATGRASKLADQTESSQIRLSKTSRANPKYVGGAALELTYLSARQSTTRTRLTTNSSSSGGRADICRQAFCCAPGLWVPGVVRSGA